jgi:hypothetical protein
VGGYARERKTGLFSDRKDGGIVYLYIVVK